MIGRDSIETAYCFFHQKERVYARSVMGWQRDDIEYAVGAYADEMNRELLGLISGGKGDFLRDHASFHSDLKKALVQLEDMLSSN